MTTTKMNLPFLLSTLWATAVAQFPTDLPCTDWVSNKAAFDNAKAMWQEPACYTFSYAVVGLSASAAESTSVSVKNGVVVGKGMSMGDFFDMIEETCFAGCPSEGAHLCKNTYAGTMGYPMSILLDLSEFTAGEEQRYTISDFSVADCSTIPDPTEAPTTSPASAPTKAPIADAPRDVDGASDKDISVIGGVQDDSSAFGLR